MNENFVKEEDNISISKEEYDSLKNKSELNPVEKKETFKTMDSFNNSNSAEDEDDYSFGDNAKLKGIKIASYVSLAAQVLFFILLTIGVASQSPTFSIIGWVFVPISAILSLYIPIKILATRWSSPKLQDSKVLWGLLSLFLLGWIGGLIFGYMKP